MDVADKIKQLLQNNITNISICRDEFNPKDPAFQILLENYPAKSVWLICGLHRIEHRVRITLYKKLISYTPDKIDSYRTEWYNMKSKIDEVLIKNKYSIEGVFNLITGTWVDDIDTIAIGMGIKTTTEPIIWQSEQVITCIYYRGEKLIEEY